MNNLIDKNNYEEVILVCHSMGGIVGALYMAKCKLDNKDSRVDKFITLGTPYLGSPKALYTLETGNFLDDLTDLSQKYNIYIVHADSCGCCGGLYLESKEGKQVADSLGYIAEKGEYIATQRKTL